jgi:hypothetical protein
MQPAIRQVRPVRPLPLLTALLALAWLHAWPPAAAAAEAAMTVSLQAGKWKSVRLRNLPRDTVLSVAVQSTGKIAVSLLSERDYRAFPAPQEPVFVGSVERTLSFTIIIPETGTYYLVLDNRQSADVRKVKFAVRAQRGARTPAPKPAPQPGQEPAPEKLQGA